MNDNDLPADRPAGPGSADDAAERVARQRGFGLANVPDSRFDELARRIAESTGATAAMVNIVGADRQYFAGLYGKAETAPGQPAFLGDPGREMDLDHGFCVHVVARRKALVLDDIYAYPRFAGNPVVDELGVRSYIGAPLIDEDGTVFGTVCAIDPVPRSTEDETSWGRHGLNVIKAAADEVLAEIRSREQISVLTASAPGPVLVTAGPGREILHVNAVHEQLFGPVRVLGSPVAEASPYLGPVGVLDAIGQWERTGTATVTEPVRLADGVRSAVFATVSVTYPGHPLAALTLGMVDTSAQTCVSWAEKLAAEITAGFPAS